jgi:hypothetical protein
MPVPNRSRNENGEFREKRADTKVQTLKETYSEFDGINGNTLLGTLKEKYNTDSLDGVLKALRKENNK